MSTARYDYGRAGRIGVGTPQANPTVEAEFRILVPPAAGLIVTRLTSAAAAPEDRLRDYLLGIDAALGAFDSLRPDVFAFACTASSYLVAPDAAAAAIARAEDRFGYPIVTAAGAVRHALDRLGARRIALLSPYPAALRTAAERYWSGLGYTLVASDQAGGLGAGADTRGIYALGSADAADALARIDLGQVDAVLLSGTGMPSLPLIAGWRGAVPVLSSNLCLAAACCAHIGAGDLLDPASPLAAAWPAACAAAVD